MFLISTDVFFPSRPRWNIPPEAGVTAALRPSKQRDHTNTCCLSQRNQAKIKYFTKTRSSSVTDWATQNVQGQFIYWNQMETSRNALPNPADLPVDFQISCEHRREGPITHLPTRIDPRAALDKCVITHKREEQLRQFCASLMINYNLRCSAKTSDQGFPSRWSQDVQPACPTASGEEL